MLRTLALVCIGSATALTFAQTPHPNDQQPATPLVSKSSSRTPVAKTAVTPPASLPPPSKVTKDFYSAVVNKNFELADALLQQGADINCSNCGDQPLLIWAATGQFMGINAPANSMEWLLARGANPNIRNIETGNSALHHVIRNALEFSKWSKNLDGFEAPIQALLDKGARPDQTNIKGANAVHYMSRFIHNAVLPSTTQFTNRVMDRLVAAGAQINRQDIEGETPLMFGLRVDMTGQVECNQSVIQHMLELGGNPQLKNKKGETAQSIVHNIAVGGAKHCNPVLAMLSGGRMGEGAAPQQSPQRPAIGAVQVPEGLAGEYTGVLRVKSPSEMTLVVTGRIQQDGSVFLNAPRGFTNQGRIVNPGSDTLDISLKTFAPEGYRFSNGTRESYEFLVRGRLSERIYRGHYSAPTDAGEFVLCPNDLVQSVPECRPSFMESLNAVVGVILGAK